MSGATAKVQHVLKLLRQTANFAEGKCREHCRGRPETRCAVVEPGITKHCLGFGLCSRGPNSLRHHQHAAACLRLVREHEAPGARSQRCGPKVRKELAGRWGLPAAITNMGA